MSKARGLRERETSVSRRDPARDNLPVHVVDGFTFFTFSENVKRVFGARLPAGFKQWGVPHLPDTTNHMSITSIVSSVWLSCGVQWMAGLAAVDRNLLISMMILRSFGPSNALCLLKKCDRRSLAQILEER